MFESNKVRKLIIVCDEKTKPYANYLMALISANDDKEDEVVGVKDGSVEAVVWSEKDFASNEPTLSSNAHILFMGDTKLSKSQRGGLGVKFNKFGMQYGWLGKRAVLFVDKVISNIDEYNDFFNFAIPYQESMTKVLEKKTKKQIETKNEKEENVEIINAKEPSESEIVINDKKEDLKDKGKKGLLALAAAASFVINPLGTAVTAGTLAITNEVEIGKKKKDVLQQQYSCLTMILYLEGLNEFLEG